MGGPCVFFTTLFGFFVPHRDRTGSVLSDLKQASDGMGDELHTEREVVTDPPCSSTPTSVSREASKRQKGSTGGVPDERGSCSAPFGSTEPKPFRVSSPTSLRTGDLQNLKLVATFWPFPHIPPENRMYSMYFRWSSYVHLHWRRVASLSGVLVDPSQTTNWAETVPLVGTRADAPVTPCLSRSASMSRSAIGEEINDINIC